MSKERLEEIERQLNRAEIKRENLDIYEFQNILEHQLINGNLLWLVKYAKEQAERVQGLETTVDFYQSALRDADRRVQELEAVNNQLERQTTGIELELLNTELTDALKQNKRYREAIEVATRNMATSDNLGVKFALGILEQALEESE